MILNKKEKLVTFMCEGCNIKVVMSYKDFIKQKEVKLCKRCNS